MTSKSSDKMKKSLTKTKNNDFKMIITVIIITAVLILAVIGGVAGYFITHADSNNASNTTTSSNANTTKAGNMPSNPNTAAVKWLETLMADTAKKFPSDTFTNGNKTLNSIMEGDDSVIPDNIKNRIEHGTNTTGISIGREVLDGSSYVGLMMFANAYNNTKQNNTQLSGDALVSYNTENNTVYIPVQAVAASDKNVVFEVRWTGSDWKLEGDPLGWQTYILLQQQAAANSSSYSSNSSN